MNSITKQHIEAYVAYLAAEERAVIDSLSEQVKALSTRIVETGDEE